MVRLLCLQVLQPQRPRPLLQQLQQQPGLLLRPVLALAPGALPQGVHLPRGLLPGGRPLGQAAGREGGMHQDEQEA